jgi:predicted ester cyclase
MSAEENMALARRFIEAWVKGDLDAMDEMMGPDFVNHTKLLPGEEPGREGFMQTIAQYTAAFSNSNVLVEDQVAAGDKVVTRCIVHRTHDRGELMGVAPTGRKMTMLVIAIHRISGHCVSMQCHPY